MPATNSVALAVAGAAAVERGEPSRMARSPNASPRRSIATTAFDLRGLFQGVMRQGRWLGRLLKTRMMCVICQRHLCLSVGDGATGSAAGLLSCGARQVRLDSLCCCDIPNRHPHTSTNPQAARALLRACADADGAGEQDVKVIRCVTHVVD